MHATRLAARALLPRPSLQALLCHRRSALWPSSVFQTQRGLSGTAAGRHARMHVAGTAAPATDAGSEAAPAAGQRAGKRKVALFIGYRGTGFRGLQMQQSMDQEQQQHLEGLPDTVEDCLEEAIFRAGGILPSNRGKLSKVSWSRSSRTDKSVHSLATVIALKMEVEPARFDTDPEGRHLAEAINAHLPPEVRVFSVQRVSKSWNARSECIRRTYSYYLPASVLGLKLDGGKEDAARLALLQQAWESFQGTHAFHNYTKRRLYRDSVVHGGNSGGRGGGKGRRGRDADTSGSEGEEEEAGVAEAQAGSPHSSSASSSSPPGSAPATAAAAEAAEAAEAAAQPGPVPSSSSGSEGSSSEAQSEKESLKGLINLAWKAEKDGSDLVNRRHYRYIEWCRADIDLKPLVPGGQPCIELSLQGGSFMLHQIRHMVGAAVAVARGHLPLELLEASMSTPARMNLPLAPPSTLMLMGAQFSPFKRSWSGEAAVAAQWTGETLQLNQQGSAAQQVFLNSCMQPALDELLAGEEWQQWGQDLDRLWYEPEQLQEVLEAYAGWRQEQEARRAARLEAKLAEAAALENPDES